MSSLETSDFPVQLGNFWTLSRSEGNFRAQFPGGPHDVRKTGPSTINPGFTTAGFSGCFLGWFPETGNSLRMVLSDVVTGASVASTE